MIYHIVMWNFKPEVEESQKPALKAEMAAQLKGLVKMSEVIAETEIGVGDRTNMLFSSSLITYGRGRAVVVETGMNTEVGKIAEMLNATEEQQTPLQMKLNKLGKTLGKRKNFSPCERNCNNS